MSTPFNDPAGMADRPLIPAGGTVDFLLHPMEEDEFDIEGPRSWARPVVGLILPRYHDAQSVIRHLRDDDPWARHLPFEPVVVDELGLLFTADDYLAQVVGEDVHEDGSSFYRPHIAGPVTGAPRVRRLNRIGEVSA